MRLSLATVALLSCAAWAGAETAPCGGSFAIMADDAPPSLAKAAITQTVKGNGITFNLSYKQGSGFDDPDRGANRRAVVDAVLAYIDSVLAETGAVDIDFQPFTLNPQALALASTFYLPQGAFDGGLPFRHITTGVDAVGSQVPDISVQVNFARVWNDDLGDPTSSEFDLFSVLLHELTHGLGMNSLSDANGASLLTNSKAFTTFDNLLFTLPGSKLWAGNPATLQVSPGVLTGGLGAAEFRGDATANNLLAYPDVYTPSQFLPSTSLNHWELNTEQFGTRALMNPSFPSGQKFRTYAPFEIRMLQDLGYDIETGALVTPTATPSLTPTPTATPTAMPSATPFPSATPLAGQAAIIRDQLLGRATGALDQNGDGVIDVADLITLLAN